MSDQAQNSEFIFKKQTFKQRLSLYSDNKQQNKHSYKPQDVISSVFLQLKAIHVADTLKSEKNVSKDLKKFSKSNFLCVNKLPVYEEVPKQTTKFDTHLVLDTQLINIIEDAETIDVHRGMTQEFETTFCHNTEKQDLVVDNTDAGVNIESNDEVPKGLQAITDKKRKEIDKIHEENTRDKVDKLSDTFVVNKITEKNTGSKEEATNNSLIANSMENNVQTNNPRSIISPIVCSNIVDSEFGASTRECKKNENTRVEEFSHILNQCIDIEDEADMAIERPLSPIIMHKHVKIKSRTLSPLIFNLGTFEQFEKIAIPILEANDFKTAKHVINSQILDKELQIKMDEEIQLNERKILSPVLQNKNVTKCPDGNYMELRTHLFKDPDSDTDFEFIELDKATSEDLINKVMNENSDDNTKVRPESEILKDEILFSSDEEDNYVQKTYQDLPFTCALETSFYDRSDVLDKTMYVGFQTASNKTIQIFTDSFAQAQSFLGDVDNDEITVTDLVKNCDSNVKNKTQDLGENQVKMNVCDTEIEFNLAQKDDIESELEVGEIYKVKNPIDVQVNNKHAKIDIGNEEIMVNLAQKDDIESDLKFAIENKAEELEVIQLNKKQTNMGIGDEETEFNLSEKDNIESELSLAVENKPDNPKDVPSHNKQADFGIDDEEIEFNLVQNDDIESELELPVENKIDNPIDVQANDKQSKMSICDHEEIEFHFAKNDNQESQLELENNAKQREVNNKQAENFEGFMTASKKVIRLSQKALARCKKVFQDIDLNENFDTQVEEVNVQGIDSNDNFASQTADDNIQDVVFNENVDTQIQEAEKSKVKGCEDLMPFVTEISKTETNDDDLQNIDDVLMQEFENIEMSLEEDKKFDQNIATIDFKTASNKDINISETALSKINDEFKDIDFEEYLTPVDVKDTVVENNVVPKSIENVQLEKKNTNLVGFKTASNKNIDISKEALAKTKNVFQDLSSIDFPKKSSLDKVNQNLIDCEQSSTSKASFTGFKTANNKDIKIPEQALAKTKIVFKDIDSTDFKFAHKHLQENSNETSVNDEPTSETNFVEFKTPNNKNIDISKQADEEMDSMQFTSKKSKEVQENIHNETEELTDFNQPSTSKCTVLGFKTANNKNIKISDAALAKTKNIFKDIDFDDFIFPSKLNKDFHESKEDKKIAKYNREHMFAVEMTDLNKTSTSKATFTGFRTANNRNITISKEALAKTMYIFKDIDSADLQLPEKNTKTMVSTENIKVTNEQNITNKPVNLNQPTTSNAGFKTASNRNIAVSKESLAATKIIFKDIHGTDLKFPEKANKDLEKYHIIEKNKVNDKKSTHESEIIDFKQPSTSKTSFAGFMTGNNKKINISEESLAKTKNIFKDIDSVGFVEPTKQKSGTTTQRVGGEEKSDYPVLKESKSKNNFIGFKTANNKLIKISETALAKTKIIFKDIDSSELQLTEKNKEDYPNIEEEIDEKEFTSINKANKSNDFKIPETSIPTFQGFQTASNKQVKVSEDALFRSRKIFQDLDMSQDFNIGNKIKEDMNTTDTDKEFSHINKRTKIDINDLTEDGKSSPVFKGFETANKKQVTVSKESLAKSNKLFQDIDKIPKDDDREPPFYGFKNANNEEVEVSQKALTETKKLFQENESNNFNFFHTASDKKVSISEDSLAKSRKIFEDIDKNYFGQNEKKTPNINFGFKTGTNRDIVVSEEAVKISKRLFSEIDDSDENLTNIKKDKINEENIANIIDTQVLNNFEESLHTEDFRDTPIKSKRSGSPILSCPRAKRRKKFETPYSQKLPQKPELKQEIDTKNVNKVTFNENYKKIKKYTLKDLEKLSRNDNATIDPYLLQFSFDNLLKFEFQENRNDLSNGKMSIDSLKELFLNSVNHKLIPKGWLDNQLKLIIWKLISYETRFNSAIICSAKNVIDQLKYRYDKELYNAQRPALRKILEKDDVASKTIVLCVAGFFEDGVSVSSATTTNTELLLTDGWYCIKVSIDKMLAQLICAGKINVGTKLVTNGAELVNCEQGVSPWEDTSAIRLKLFGNSTRRARWDARLGYHSNGAILSQLSSVKLDGGKVSKLRLFVTRVYPALYVDKFEDGSTVTRSERLEHLHQMKCESERQAVMEKIYEEVEREFADQESQDSEGLSELSNKRTCFDSGTRIAKVMKRSKDPAEFRAGLTSSQMHLLEAHSSKNRERILQDIQQRIRDKIEKAGVCVNRNVVTLLKIRVAGTEDRNGVRVTKGMMSIWKPTDAVLEIIKEGTWIDVMNVVPTAVRYSEIQISAGRQSVFSTSKYKEPEKFKPYTKLLKRNCYTIKDLAQNPSMSTDYNEIDTVGCIFLIDPSIQEFDSSKQPFQNVFLADADKSIICINFWGGLKKFGFENVLDTGQIVVCTNLQKRAGNSRKSISQYRVTEFSYFTKTPKNENARNILDDLSKKFLSLDRRKFCEDCVVLKNNYSVIKMNNENISPYRFNNSDYNISKNKMFIDSPLTRPNKMDDNLNLTGLDFESTFRQTDTQNLTEEVLLRKKKVNEKIARLKMYGEPPPLSTIHIINKSRNASSSYKSPLQSNNNNSKITIQKSIENAKLLSSKSDSSENVASVKETPEKCGNLNHSDVACSPVLINRTYVKNVNPVKINFDVKDNNDSAVDHFAEDFDASPPLSLD